jgi:hypothetical protein
VDDVFSRMGRQWRLADSVSSMATGLGVLGIDKARDARPAHPAWLSPQEQDDAVVVEGILRRVVYAVPEDALAQGWRTDSRNSAATDITADLDDALGLESVLEEVDAVARQYGGCYALMVCEGVTDLRKPLPPGPHDVVAVHPLMALECLPLTWDANLKSKNWTNPELFQVQAIRPGIGQGVGVVHRSHMLYMPGLPRSRTTINPTILGYDISVVQAYWEAVRDLGLARRSAALALMEQSMVVMTVPGGQAMFSADDAEVKKAWDALDLWGRTRSTRGTALLTGNNSVQRLEAPMTGLGEGVRVQYEQLGAVEGIPITVLMTTPPGGLSGDDVAARKSYRKFLQRHQRRRLTPWLLDLYRVALGDERRVIHWPDPEPPTAAEEATISSTRATRDSTLVALGAITPEEVRARFAGDEELPLPVVLPDAPEPDDSADNLGEG